MAPLGGRTLGTTCFEGGGGWAYAEGVARVRPLVTLPPKHSCNRTPNPLTRWAHRSTCFAPTVTHTHTHRRVAGGSQNVGWGLWRLIEPHHHHHVACPGWFPWQRSHPHWPLGSATLQPTLASHGDVTTAGMASDDVSMVSGDVTGRPLVCVVAAGVHCGAVHVRGGWHHARGGCGAFTTSRAPSPPLPASVRNQMNRPHMPTRTSRRSPLNCSKRRWSALECRSGPGPI